ncbi:MAG: DNA translocase FtsK 4TM domain-containing protein, partial [Alistipes sp.]|nr:DNA translocase FtsK 4TM domain-containing protein [Alistipes sp.]
MVSRNTQSSPNGRQTVQRTSGDNARWTAGLVLFFLGLFALVAVLSSYFCWDADQSCLQRPADEREMLGLECENLCGRAGAQLGRLLVDDSFGVCGILIPVIVLLLGVRIIRQRPLRLNHSALSLLLVMILGSLTFGFFLRDNLSLFASTGWGGAFGIEAAAFLRMHIGAVGTLILLAGGWILTGVFINRSFINTVNEAGNVVVDRSEKIVDSVLHKVVHARSEMDEPMEEPVPEPVRASAAPAPAAPEEEPMRLDLTAEEEYPFVDEAPAGPVEVEIDRTERAEAFPEERIPSAASGRVVMGAGGLVELESPEERVAAPAPAAVRNSGGPFEEFVIGHEEPEPEPLPESEPEPEPFGVPGAYPAEGADRFPEEPAIGVAAGGAEAGGVVVTVEAKSDRLADEKSITTESYDPLKDLVNYRKPPVTLLEDYLSDSEVSDEEIYENKSKIEETLKYFGIPIQRIKATVGPTVTLYEIVQAQGVKISKIQGLENDIAQSLKALGIRIIAPIPGKGTIGIEVPNRDKQVVSMYSSVRSMRFQESKAELPVVIGRTIQNENYVFDLAKMPHLLVAGATGQGKSVGLNAIITSLLYRKHPAQLKFVMIDPKMVEFSLYAKLERHFLAKMESEDKAIITDPMKAVYTLNSLCTEMDNRLELCSEAGARNIVEYNVKFTSRRLNPEKGHRYLPYIVVVVDEVAPLFKMAREVERPRMRRAP